MRYPTLTAPELLDRAKAYFGPSGTGLNLLTERRRELTFRGGGGHVAMYAQAVTPGSPTQLHIETYQWDEAVRHFIAGLPHYHTWWQRWWPWGQ